MDSKRDDNEHSENGGSSRDVEEEEVVEEGEGKSMEDTNTQGDNSDNHEESDTKPFASSSTESALKNREASKLAAYDEEEGDAPAVLEPLDSPQVITKKKKTAPNLSWLLSEVGATSGDDQLGPTIDQVPLEPDADSAKLAAGKGSDGDFNNNAATAREPPGRFAQEETLLGNNQQQPETASSRPSSNGPNDTTTAAGRVRIFTYILITAALALCAGLGIGLVVGLTMNNGNNDGGNTLTTNNDNNDGGNTDTAPDEQHERGT